MSSALQGTAAVVTGASSGIGRAIAIALAQAGVSHIAIHFRRNIEGANESAQRLRDLGCQATLLAADLSCEEDRVQLIEQAFAALGSIHTWVNNAGADVLTGAAADGSFEQKLDQLWHVDVRGTLLLARQLGPQLAAQKLEHPASMLFIGWDQAPRGMEGDAGMMFGPTKAAVMAFANSLAQTLAPQVRVNTIAPGWIQTSWGKQTSDYWDRRARGEALMNRWGTPQDVARAAVYLADPANSFLTGQTIEVNGGWKKSEE